MPYLLNFVYGLALTALSPFLLYRAATTGKYRQGVWRKLHGAPPQWDRRGGPVVWFHAVSVGEVMLLEPLFDRLRKLRPDLEIVLSTSTNTGFALAKDRYPDVPIFYAPLDFTWAVGRVLDDLRPALLVLTELELWPNILIMAKSRGIPVAVVNARLGERSFRGYSRIARWLRPSLSAIRWWGAQTEVYRKRIESLIGSSSDMQSTPVVVETTGSLKYDGAQTDRSHPKVLELRRLLGLNSADRVLLAGSTMEPEEEIVIEAFEKLSRSEPRLRLILVPRHKERFETVAAMLKQRGVPFVRRSQIDKPREHAASVTLVDTIGELSFLWGLANWGFVGGSLECRRGGQSMIEPAGFGVPVCVGPNTWNFQDAVARLLEQKAIVVVGDRSGLLAVWRDWLANDSQAQAIGARAKAFLSAQQGSVEKTTRAVLELLPTPASIRKSA